ncbi:sulfatase [Olivibacter ginsenosidimutans]|uniref:Sulfatase n=1 Tax=Olivibacter ginsenosidimutans TaxID=1176537 RepID=A0ABP9BUH4_9SPHI
MYKRLILLKTCLLGVLHLYAVSSEQPKNRQDAPNIVFIIVDDLGWRDVGYKGNHYLETPNIDQLSKEGMVFNNAYSNAPNCAPTRAALISGQYGPRTGIYTVGTAERGETKNRKLIPVKNKTELDSAVYTLPEALKDHGYATGIFGKWHLGTGSENGPEVQGFDRNVGGGKAGSPKSYFSPYHNPQLKDGVVGEELTERLTSEAISFIEQSKHQPFFVYLPYYAVHVPLQAKPELVEKYKKKATDEERYNPTYAALMETVDTQIGRLLTYLKTAGLTDNTLVVFTSDNGPFFPVTSAAPLNGSKGMLYEGGIRVPLIVKWPNKIKAGSASDEPVMSIDFFPTFLKLTNAKVPETKALDGVDLSPIWLKTGKIAERTLYWHFPAYLEAYKGMDQLWRQKPGGAIRKGNWKLIQTFEDNRVELFNLQQDEYERHNLAQEHPDKAAELLHDLQQWQIAIKAPIPTALNPLYKP